MGNLSRRSFLESAAVLGLTAAVTHVGAAPANAATDSTVGGALAAAPAGLPSLDSLGSEWLEPSHTAKRPEINNFWGTVGATANVAGVELLALVPYTQGGSACDVTFDGVSVPTRQIRWTAYDISRLGETANGLLVRTATRLAFEANQLLLQITVANPTAAAVTTTMAMALTPRIRKYTSGWTWAIPRPGDQNFTARVSGANVIVSDNSGRAVSAFAFTGSPQLSASGAAGTAQWTLSVAPGASTTVSVVLAFGDTTTGQPLVNVSDASTVVAAANTAMGSFATVLGNAAAKWTDRWNDAFTPGNAHYSGSLPVLSTNSAAINRLYYMSVLSVITTERTNLGPAFNSVLQRTGTFSGFNRIYTSGSGLYGETTMFFWDTSYASVLLALLDPQMLKAYITHWMTIDVHKCLAMDALSGGPVRYWYSANDMTVSSTIFNYVNLTGDWNYLSTSVAGKTMLQHLTYYATFWKTLVPAGQNLADYGANHNLLEMLPKYTNQVASMNAANVWLMRKVADYKARLGDQTGATQLTTDATNLVPHVMDLYVDGQGVWNCRHADGSLATVRTVVDFLFAGPALAKDLTAAQKTEMKAFVTNELMDRDWLRALSMSDSQVPTSRTDHGERGAYDTWPAITAQTFARFGDYAALRTQLEAYSATTKKGPFGQSHQLMAGVYGYRVPDRPQLNPTTAITLTAWINASSWPANIWEGTIIGKDNHYGMGGYVLRGGAGGKLSFVVYLAGGSYAELQTPTAVTAGWHHVAATYNGSTMAILVDGVVVASKAQTGAVAKSTGTDLMVGACPVDVNRAFRGAIHGAQVYGRALSTSEVSAQVSAGNPLGGTTDPALLLRVPRSFGAGTPFPDTPALNPTGALTVSAWINAAGWPANVWEGSIIAKDDFGVNHAGYVLRGGAGGVLSFVITVGTQYYELRTTGTLTAGWHHVAATYDGATMRVYVDGVQKASRAQTGALAGSANPVVIGASPRDLTRQFLGRIDDARVYSRALTATEISAAGAAGNPFVGSTDPALALWYPAISGPGPVGPRGAICAGDGMVYNACTGGSFAGVVITDLFGYAPDGQQTRLTDPAQPRGISGTLSGLRFNGVSRTITSGTGGLTIS